MQTTRIAYTARVQSFFSGVPVLALGVLAACARAPSPLTDHAEDAVGASAPALESPLDQVPAKAFAVVAGHSLDAADTLLSSALALAAQPRAASPLSKGSAVGTRLAAVHGRLEAAGLDPKGPWALALLKGNKAFAAVLPVLDRARAEAELAGPGVVLRAAGRFMVVADAAGERDLLGFPPSEALGAIGEAAIAFATAGDATFAFVRVRSQDEPDPPLPPATEWITAREAARAAGNATEAQRWEDVLALDAEVRAVYAETKTRGEAAFDRVYGGVRFGIGLLRVRPAELGLELRICGQPGWIVLKALAPSGAAPSALGGIGGIDDAVAMLLAVRLDIGAAHALVKSLTGPMFESLDKAFGGSFDLTTAPAWLDGSATWIETAHVVDGVARPLGSRVVAGVRDLAGVGALIARVQKSPETAELLVASGAGYEIVDHGTTVARLDVGERDVAIRWGTGVGGKELIRRPVAAPLAPEARALLAESGWSAVLVLEPSLLGPNTLGIDARPVERAELQPEIPKGALPPPAWLENLAALGTLEDELLANITASRERALELRAHLGRITASLRGVGDDLVVQGSLALPPGKTLGSLLAAWARLGEGDVAHEALMMKLIGLRREMNALMPEPDEP